MVDNIEKALYDMRTCVCAPTSSSDETSFLRNFVFFFEGDFNGNLCT